MKAPVYLVYSSAYWKGGEKTDILSPKQIKGLEDLADEIPNLFLIDYFKDDFARKAAKGQSGEDKECVDAFYEKINEAFEKYIERKGVPQNKRQPDSLGSIGYLVDLLRLFMVYRPDILLDISRDKYPDVSLDISDDKYIKHQEKNQDFLDDVRYGLIYQDHDVTQEDPRKPIILQDGVASINNAHDVIAED